MVMLSELRRHVLVDTHGHTARLFDLAVDLSVGDYPLVTRILFRTHNRQTMSIPWDPHITPIWSSHKLRVKDLRVGRAAPAAALKRTVLLNRDVLDALVLDVSTAQAMRANDLWLRHDDGKLWLCAADASPWAVIRRLARGLLGSGAERRLVDWKNVEFLRGDPEAARSGGDYHRRIARLPAVTIAHLATAVPFRHAAELLSLLPDPLAADTLEELPPERQLQVWEALDNEQSLRLLALMAPDTATDLVGRLTPDEAAWVLEHLPADEAQRVVDLLRYPEDTAGGIMTNDVPIVPAGLTVAEARRSLREHLRAPDFVYYVYVVDARDTLRLEGVFSLRDLLVSDELEPVANIMQRAVLTIDPLEPASSAARRVCDLHLAALPVVGRDRRLLGAVTVDTALAQVAPASWREQSIRIFS
jgi:CBS domain-containing protein